MIILAPRHVGATCSFSGFRADPDHHESLLRQMQALRAQVYLADRAIQESDLDQHGRHVVECDHESWHLLAVDTAEKPVGCLRLFLHPRDVRCDSLRFYRATLAYGREWAPKVASAIEAELRRAAAHDQAIVEIGGWAVAKQFRHTTTALKLVLGTFAWAQIIGGCRGIGTATVRNHSSSILRRVGGSRLKSAAVEIPAYYDPAHGCEMEILRFDEPAPAFVKLVSEIREQLKTASTIGAMDNRGASSWQSETSFTADLRSLRRALRSTVPRSVGEDAVHTE
jgi:hypothetical protein